MNSGKENQRSRTVGLTQGVTIEINPMPPTTTGQAFLAQAIARACRSPSVFRTSQQAPSRMYAAGRARAMRAAKASYCQPSRSPVT